MPLVVMGLADDNKSNTNPLSKTMYSISRTTPLMEAQRPRLEALLTTIGDTWEDLMTLVQWVITPRPLPTPTHDEWKQVIIRGETDGTMGLEIVKELFTWNPHASLILSGGVYGREKTIGDIGAIDLYRQLEQDLMLLGYHGDDIKSRVLIDSISRHTVDQGRILSPLLKALDAEEVFLVLPLYHLPRFLLTLGKGLEKNNFTPRIVPLAYGTWTTHHPRKSPRQLPHTTFRYEELFSLPPSPSHFPGKDDCGEIDKIITHVRAGHALTIKECVTWLNLSSTPRAETNTTDRNAVPAAIR